MRTLAYSPVIAPAGIDTSRQDRLLFDAGIKPTWLEVAGDPDTLQLFGHIQVLRDNPGGTQFSLAYQMYGLEGCKVYGLEGLVPSKTRRYICGDIHLIVEEANGRTTVTPVLSGPIPCGATGPGGVNKAALSIDDLIDYTLGMKAAGLAADCSGAVTRAVDNVAQAHLVNWRAVTKYVYELVGGEERHHDLVERADTLGNPDLGVGEHKTVLTKLLNIVVSDMDAMGMRSLS